MKEDVLEQIVDDYLQLKGYFTTHNVRFSPRKGHPDYDSRQDSVSSDIDVATPEPEFAQWKWLAIESLPRLIVPFKRDTYAKVISAFQKYAIA